MNILMMSNTYTPLVGGLERSVRDCTMAYRRRGHRVVVVAPAFEGMPADEEDVVRLPAIPHVRGSQFSLQLPIPGVLSRALQGFKPEIIHAHHPFLIGNTALRIARARKIPLVFTHHTLFEHYLHDLPIQTPAAAQFMIKLVTGYANLCDQVFAPSRGVAALMRRRGITSPIRVIPTGIDIQHFARGRGSALRRSLGIPAQAFVIGHVGRLAPEKNLEFLAGALALFLQRRSPAHLLLIGDGPAKEACHARLQRAGVQARVHDPGVLQDQALVDAYHAMDAFAFASKSETQGLVVAEAMAAGVPVVALDACGVNEVVQDRRNGRLVRLQSAEEFAAALQWMADRPAARRRLMGQQAKARASHWAIERCADAALACYAALRYQQRRSPIGRSPWAMAMRWLRSELSVVKNFTTATGAAITTGANDVPPSTLRVSR